MIQRRSFLTLFGGAAAAWPLAAKAQQDGRVRRVGVLMGYEESDPEAKALLSGFVQGLEELGWTDGRNARIDIRWAAGNIDRMQSLAKELVELQPDVILSNTTPVTAALQRLTRAVPIVFVIVADPVGAGFVASLSRPGGNITGFINEEREIVGKWVELLTEIAPAVKRVAIMFNPDTAAGGGSYYLPAFRAAAESLKVEPIVVPVRSDPQIEAAIAMLGREPGSGLVTMNDGFVFVHRAQIISAANKNNVPAVYHDPIYARYGGLLGYGPDRGDIFRRAAPYVDRILRGARPADLPVQLPVKFQLGLNARTAKALGVTVPPSILLRADEVIE